MDAMMNRPVRIVAVHVFLVKDDQILMLRRKNTDYEDGKLSVLAGHVEASEKMTEAAIREVEEESGVRVKFEDLRFVHVMDRIEEDERVDFFFECKKWDGEIKNMELGKCEELLWVKIDELPDDTIPYIASAIEKYQKKSRYSEFRLS